MKSAVPGRKDRPYQDRDNRPITLAHWSVLLGHPRLRVVKKTRVTDDLIVSTVWTGISADPWTPTCFESAIIRGNKIRPVLRYVTERQAHSGHSKLVHLCRNKAAR